MDIDLNKIVNHLYNVKEDSDYLLSVESYQKISILRQLINEEFKPERQITTQNIYDILKEVLN